MFWGWMIDPGKRSLARNCFTTPDNFTTQPPVSSQEEITISDLEILGRDCTLLLKRGFALEEAHSLCKLQRWYQNGGSDRALVIYHLEFLRRLVANGSLER